MTWLWILLKIFLSARPIEPRALPSGGTYQLLNYTWQVINEANDIVLSNSRVGENPHWPILTVDLCHLALGTHSDWGKSSLYWPQSKAPIGTLQMIRGKGLLPQLTDPGCGSIVTHVSLVQQLHDLQGGGFYVCPGNHCDHSLRYKCGFSPDYFCASWEYETTGNTYWKPSSSWDLIKVTPDSTPSTQVCNPIKAVDSYPWCKFGCTSDSSSKGWCNPIKIAFTDMGKAYNWFDTHPPSWGL